MLDAQDPLATYRNLADLEGLVVEQVWVLTRQDTARATTGTGRTSIGLVLASGEILVRSCVDAQTLAARGRIIDASRVNVMRGMFLVNTMLALFDGGGWLRLWTTNSHGWRQHDALPVIADRTWIGE